jgi:hypothetical protein
VTALREAAADLMANAIDTEACYPEANQDIVDDDYPVDEDDNKWYADWWRLKLALDAAKGGAS